MVWKDKDIFTEYKLFIMEYNFKELSLVLFLKSLQKNAMFLMRIIIGKFLVASLTDFKGLKKHRYWVWGKLQRPEGISMSNI